MANSSPKARRPTGHSRPGRAEYHFLLAVAFQVKSGPGQHSDPDLGLEGSEPPLPAHPPAGHKRASHPCERLSVLAGKSGARHFLLIYGRAVSASPRGIRPLAIQVPIRKACAPRGSSRKANAGLRRRSPRSIENPGCRVPGLPIRQVIVISCPTVLRTDHEPFPCCRIGRGSRMDLTAG